MPWPIKLYKIWSLFICYTLSWAILPPYFLNYRLIVLTVPGTHPFFSISGPLHENLVVRIIFVLPHSPKHSCFCPSDFSWNVTYSERSALVILHKIELFSYYLFQSQICNYLFHFSVNVYYLFTCLLSGSSTRLYDPWFRGHICLVSLEHAQQLAQCWWALSNNYWIKDGSVVMPRVIFCYEMKTKIIFILPFIFAI